MPKVSVVVPVCNVEKYIKQCLDSIINQTLEDIEVICVDDGSGDNSGQILDLYASNDKRISVIHKKNTGYGNSMNVGIEHAAGDYIAVVESDDFAEPDMLEKLYGAALESSADIVKANHYNYRGGCDYFCDWVKNFPKGQVINSEKYPEIIVLANTIWTCLYKRAFLMDNQICFHETPGAAYQDISFAIQGWIMAKRVYFIEDAVLHYRNDNPGSSMYNPSKIFSVFDEYNWLEKKYEEFWKKHMEQEQCFIACKYQDYFNHYFRIGAPYQYAYLIELKKMYQADKSKKRIQQSVVPEHVWQWLQDIDMDMYGFFSKTGKQLDDLRLKICLFQNDLLYVEAFIDMCRKANNIILYGAGQIGQAFAKGLINRKVKITGFAVTEMGNQNSECIGIPVKELTEWEQLAEHGIVIISVAERNQYEMYTNLEKHQFKNIYRVDEKLRLIIED